MSVLEDKKGIGDVNRDSIVMGQVMELGCHSEELGSHGRLSTVRFVF